MQNPRHGARMSLQGDDLLLRTQIGRPAHCTSAAASMRGPSFDRRFAKKIGDK
jgi:hypothetical protein